MFVGTKERAKMSTLWFSKVKNAFAAVKAFTKVKDSWPRQRTAGWTSKQRFLSPLLAYFPLLINKYFVDISRV